MNLVAAAIVVAACFSVLVTALVLQRKRSRELEDERDLYCLRLAEQLEVATKAGDIKDLGIRMREHSLNPWTMEFCTGKPIPYRTGAREAADACFIKANDPVAGDRCYIELATELAAAYRIGRNAR